MFLVLFQKVLSEAGNLFWKSAGDKLINGLCGAMYLEPKGYVEICVLKVMYMLTTGYKMPSCKGKCVYKHC